jgi:hypothetical protein
MLIINTDDLEDVHESVATGTPHLVSRAIWLTTKTIRNGAFLRKYGATITFLNEEIIDELARKLRNLDIIL